MKRMLVFALAVALCGSVAMATDINLTVQSGGSSTVTASPGATVDYIVIGELTDTANEGLALVGFDLEFTGGDLAQADTPTTAPMNNFVRNLGITNPAGYGGTVQSGKLIQCGGAQNTIMNGQVLCDDNDDCPSGSNCVSNVCEPVAAFPVGTVITDVAALGSPQVLLTGSLTVPMTEGTYYLRIMNAAPNVPFANVIQQYETGVPFWATEAAGVGTVTELTVNVIDVCSLDSAWPEHEHSLWRTQNNYALLTLDCDVPAVPAAGDLKIRQMLAGGAFGPDLSGSFTFTIDAGDAMTLMVQEVGANLTHNTWIAITNDGSWAGVDPFEVHYLVLMGDVDDNARVLALDAGAVYPAVPCVNTTLPCWDPRKDVTGDNRILAIDAGAVYPNVPTIGIAKPSGH